MAKNQDSSMWVIITHLVSETFLGSIHDIQDNISAVVLRRYDVKASQTCQPEKIAKLFRLCRNLVH